MQHGRFRRLLGAMSLALGMMMLPAGSAEPTEAGKPGRLQITVGEGGPAAPGLLVRRGGGGEREAAGDRLLLEYRFGDVAFKPYVKQLLSPGGVNVLRDAPEDHLHHHGLMFAVAVDGIDFWAEPATAGRQTHRGFNDVKVVERGDMSVATFTERLDWLDPRGNVLALEDRRVEVRVAGELGASLLTWRTRLRPAAGNQSITISGSHYFGLGMRLPESMDRSARFLHSDGAAGDVVRGDERLARSRWCAAIGRSEAAELLVVMFDHPDNIRHPATWFTMADPFAYLSGTLNVWKQPLVVSRDEPLELTYGVAACDRALAPAEIEKLYRSWLRLTEPTLE